MTTSYLASESGAKGAEHHCRYDTSLFYLILRFTEPGGVTVPGRADPNAVEERDRAHVLLDAGPDGRPRLPGTSLAGALRERIRVKRGDDVADDLFGRLLPPGDGEEVDARASRVWVLGSRLLGDAAPEYRASTKIDRLRGAAQAQTLRVEEVLPAGARFEVFLRWDDAAVGEIEDFAGLLAGWRPLIGRGVSRGRGRCVVEEVRHGTLCLDEPRDLLRWLTDSGPELVRSAAVTGVPFTGPGSEDSVVRVPMSIVGPWRIGSGEKPPEGEAIPMLRVRGQFVVPGAGVKGVLRSRAEFILRSTGMSPPVCDSQQCGLCWTCRVFGHGGGDDVSSATVGARALVRVADAVVNGAVPICRTHVAIDRFTGGALDGALYKMEALEAGEFVVLVEPLGELSGDLAGEIRAVLRLVLEDLHDGIIGMGGGTARGYGSVSADFGAASGLPCLDDARRVLAGMVRDS